MPESTIGYPDALFQLFADLAQTVHNLESGGVILNWEGNGHAGLDWRLCPALLCGHVRARWLLIFGTPTEETETDGLPG